LPRTDAPLIWDMLWEDLIKNYGKQRARQHKINGSGARVGNWRPTYIGKDQTVKQLSAMEVGIFSLDDQYVNIYLVDERGSKLQIVLPWEVADNLTRAISERSIFIQNEQHR
jgi:hypothetical protein